MEQMNAEQIRYKMSEKQIKTALECLSKPNSSPADREKCYFMWKEPSCFSCYHEVAQKALYLINSQEQRIKELNEENERLRVDNEILKMPRATIFEIADAFDRGRKKGEADTVRKMQERLTSFFEADDIVRYNEVDADYINEQINEIANKLLEEK